MRGDRRVLTVILPVLVLVAPACNRNGSSRGLPNESYAWNPALARTQGKLDDFVRDLPLGTVKTVVHRHPLDDDGTVVITNGGELLPFMHKPDKGAVLAYATAYYEQNGMVSGVADAELLKPGQQVSQTKDKEYMGDNASMLTPTTALFEFFPRPVHGLLPDGGPCRLYVVESDRAPSFVLLVGQKQNLYLEIAANGTIKSADPAPDDVFQANAWKWEESSPAKPFDAVPDWSQEPLRKLREANDKTQLGVCALPS